MRVLHSKMADGPLAQALRGAVLERTNVIEALRRWLQDDSRVRAAWLWGSFLRAEEDDLSDIDLWILVPDACVDGFGEVLQQFLGSLPDLVHQGINPHNAPPSGGYVGALLARPRGLLPLDLYWQAESVGEVPNAPLLVDRTREPAPDVPCGWGGPAAAVLHDDVLHRFGFLWLMMSVAAKYLARDSSSDMALLSYPRPSFVKLVAMLDASGAVGEVDWSVPELPLEKVDLLRHIGQKTAILEEVARQRGIPVSPMAQPALRAYFDLVAEILDG